jgi:hypothetical protein
MPEELYFGFLDGSREIKVRVHESVPEPGGKLVNPPALMIDLQFDAPSLSSALHESHKLANSVVGLLSYMSCTGLPPPFLISAFDLTDGETTHDFIQLVNLPLDGNLSRAIDLRSLAGFVKGNSGLPENQQGAVFRALRWICHANDERNYLFRFLANWFALESLELILEERLDVHPRRIRLRGEPQTPGVAAFVATLKDLPRGFYDDARKLRNDLVHGSVKLGERGEEAKGLNPDLASAAFKAVAFVSNWTPPRGVPQPTVYAGTPRRASLRTRVHAQKPGFFGTEKLLPHFDEESIVQAAKQLVEQKPAIILDPRKLKPTMAEGVSFEPAALTVHTVEIDWIDVNIELVGRGG